MDKSNDGEQAGRMIVRYAMKSSQGDRDYNEDTIQMKELPGRRVFVLADGLGGCGHGQEASGAAVKSVLYRFVWNGDTESFVSDAIEGAQSAVMEKQRRNPDFGNMSTTLVILELTEDRAKWGHIGDSRLYMFRGGKVHSQTLDHSVPQMLARMGQIKPEEIRHHPDRNRLLHVIGYPWSGTPYVTADPVELQAGDAFLLCSDGFWEYIDENEMCRTLKNSGHVAVWLENMMGIVKKRGRGKNMDNFSAVCVQIQ